MSGIGIAAIWAMRAWMGGPEPERAFVPVAVTATPTATPHAGGEEISAEERATLEEVIRRRSGGGS